MNTWWFIIDLNGWVDVAELDFEVRGLTIDEHLRRLPSGAGNVGDVEEAQRVRAR